ncbi:RICIN domain-containing protein [Chitinophaga vietnamensis]|uniref:RICIN domain-containing protein n=1 Tax=Chitinophaga vietnamensis TaxID=2593957 RepID=UPI001376026C|nr:RICIN domain-containing protein [Chitinophaga vietnamensis]
MKQVCYLFLITLLFSCTRNQQELQPLKGKAAAIAGAATSASSLVAYKNSSHKLFVGYLVADGADPVPAYNPANAPDSVDFLEFFAGRDPQRSDWRAAQAKGTRIVVCHFVSDAYFDGSVKDPSTPAGTGSSSPTSSSTYDHWARDMYQQHIVADSLDGIDLDIESGTLGGDVPNSTNLLSLLKSVAKYFGPNSTSALTVMGKKPVFFFDTDGSVGDGPIYTNYKSNYDYVLFQSYTSGSHYWSGSGTADFGPLVSLYGSDKLIYLVNGDNFDGSNLNDVPSTSLWSYAQWVVANNGVGVGAYRMSRDYNHNPVFNATRKAIQIMNPASGGTSSGITSGHTYKIFSAVNNTSVLDVSGGSTADGTKVELWSNNSPSSTNQQWIVTDVGSGYYKLQPVNAPGKMMDVSASGTADGTQVQIYTDNGTNAQKWKITSLGGGYYNLSPACAPGSSLDDNAQGTANGNKIQIWTSNGTVAQQWKFVEQ